MQPNPPPNQGLSRPAPAGPKNPPDETRRVALEYAKEIAASPDETVRRARQYLQFLEGGSV